MDEKEQVKLSGTVVLADAAYLNYVIADMKAHFEKLLHRPLDEIHFPKMVACQLLEAGASDAPIKTDVSYLFVYDEASRYLFHCFPSDLKEELDGWDLRLGNACVRFAGIPTEGVVSRQDLFLDLLTVIADAADVKKLVVISWNEEYGRDVTEILEKVKDKKGILQLRMDHEVMPYKCDILAFSLMEALGIRGDELPQ